ncbi:MAG: carboxypeptidase-like regulatory domain-containing protein [bacterium]
MIRNSKGIFRSICGIFIAAGIFALAGCGGGGGGGGAAAPPATTGAISGWLDRGAVARTTGRTEDRAASIIPVSNASVTVTSGSQSFQTNTNGLGYFEIAGLPPGNYIEATAVSGALTLKAYYDVTAGQIASKSINARTTAAAMVYKRLTVGIPSHVSFIENSRLIADVESEIETALAAGNYNYDTVYAGANTLAVIAKVNAGARFEDTTVPVISVIYPQAAAQISDVDFRSESFYIEVTYSDSAPMDAGSLNVTLKMDSDPAQNVTSYFQAVNSTTLRSSGIYVFNRTLFLLPSNDHSRIMTVSVSLKDMSGNTGTASRSFTVYPVSPPPQ